MASSGTGWIVEELPTSLAEWVAAHKRIYDSELGDVPHTTRRAAREALTAVATAVASLRGRRALTPDECRAAVASRRLELLQAAAALGHIGANDARDELRRVAAGMTRE